MGLSDSVRAELQAGGQLDPPLIDYVVQVVEEGEDQVKDDASLAALIGEHLLLYEAVPDEKAVLCLCQKIWNVHSKSTSKSTSSSSKASSSASSITSNPPRLAAPVRIELDIPKISSLVDPSSMIPSTTSSFSTSSTVPAAHPSKKKTQSKVSSSPSLSSETKANPQKAVVIKTAATDNALANSSVSQHNTTTSATPNKQASSEENDSREEGPADEDETDDSALVPQRLDSYFLSGEWKQELKVRQPMQYSAAELAAFVRRAGKGTKQEESYNKFAGVLEAGEVTGALLLAGGSDQLADRGQNFVHRTQSVVKRIARDIYVALEKEQKRALSTSANAESSYFDFYGEPSAREADQMVWNEFKFSDLKAPLRRCLMVYTVDNVRYSHLRSTETKLDVNSVHRRVARVLQAQAAEQFKVVSVSAFPAHDVIQKNFIFFKSTKEGKSRWEPLASVDFDQHGAAPPGHWHLNRAPDGDTMQHWGPSINEIFHGDPTKCPLWWLLIPEHFKYKNTPDRLL